MKKILLNIFSITFVCLSLTAQTTFGPKQTINSNTGNDPYAIASGLIDGDEYIDIITATTITNQLVWYKNNGDKTFTAQSNIPNTINFVGSIMLVDLNNDTFLDLLVSAYTSNSVTWYANDGGGNFGAEQLIGTANGASGIDVGMIDGDTTIDVAVTSYDDNNVVWFANNGSGVFGSANTIDNTLIAPGTVNLKDIDNDGDLDAVISTAQYNLGNFIEIFRNNLVPSGTVSFTKDATSVTTGKRNFANVIFEDLDGDMDLDILATEISFNSNVGNFYRYENTGAGFTETSISTTFNNPSTTLFRDLDDDGLKDIVLTNAALGPTGQVAWFKNNGGGNFGAQAIIDATQSNTYVMTIDDFDNDNDLDIASLSYNQDDLNWFENLKYTLSTDEFFIHQLSVYPNPTKDKLNFKGSFTEPLKISVSDVVGKVLLTTTINAGGSLDVSNLNSGMYILNFEGTNSNFKFIKQ